jgi:hypothetical protein
VYSIHATFPQSISENHLGRHAHRRRARAVGRCCRTGSRQQLETHRDAPAIFVLIHIQQRAHGVDGWPKHGVHERDERPKGEAVMKLLESTPNVRAVFHGHNHLETGVFVSGERRYFFDSHAGGRWGAKRGYRIVEIHEDHKMVTCQMNAEDDAVSNSHELAG